MFVLPEITSKGTQVEFWQGTNLGAKDFHSSGLRAFGLRSLNVHIRKKNELTTCASIKRQGSGVCGE